jgi:hypothetical protein
MQFSNSTRQRPTTEDPRRHRQRGPIGDPLISIRAYDNQPSKRAPGPLPHSFEALCILVAAPKSGQFILAPASAFDNMIFIHRASFVLIRFLLLKFGCTRMLMTRLVIFPHSCQWSIQAQVAGWPPIEDYGRPTLIILSLRTAQLARVKTPQKSSLLTYTSSITYIYFYSLPQRPLSSLILYSLLSAKRTSKSGDSHHQ